MNCRYKEQLMNLTAEQIKAIDEGEPVPVVVEGRQCVLLNSKLYDQIRETLVDWDPPTMRRHMADMMANDWNDPAMSVYDD